MEILRAILCRDARQIGERTWEHLGEFNRVSFPSFPATLSPVTVLIDWRMEASEQEGYPMVIQVADEDGKQVGHSIVTEKAYVPELVGQRVVGVLPARFRAITFATPGAYRAEVRVGADLLWSRAFDVVQRDKVNDGG